MEKSIQLNKLTIGVCYYPEQWEKSLWESDLKRMKECGISVVRIAEFAWNIFEPKEGEFSFEFFDSFLKLAEKYQMKVIFCTPTATPPAWASRKYPEILNADIYGNLYCHGQRRHYNYNSRKYNQLTEIIVTKIAQHYGNSPTIIGWQIDNEINCELSQFYSESDVLAFRVYLEEKYGTIHNLNKAWGTVFWNQTYDDWEQINLPGLTPSNGMNPHQVMDYKRFVSFSACRYVKMQSDLLKLYIDSRMFITTNGIFDGVDSHNMTEESLDFITFDSYPNLAYCLDADPNINESLNDRKWSSKLALTRSISPNFGIMEQQTGANGWNTRMEAVTPKPGQMTLWTMQSIAHGADFISYFRWRTGTMGTEIYWHGILDYSSRDNLRLAELKKISEKIKILEDIAGSKYKAQIALVNEYHNIWDAELDIYHERLDHKSRNSWFVASQLLHTPMDQLFINNSTEVEELLKYRLLVYPHAVILTDTTAALLLEYVEKGGNLIMGCRAGMKDETGKCPMHNLPGKATEICGVDVVDYVYIGESNDQVNIIWNDLKIEAAIFNDILRPTLGGEILGFYDNNHYKGTPGLITKKFSSDSNVGIAYYFGGVFSVQAAETFLSGLDFAEPYKDKIILPRCCELAVRVKEEQEYFFILNYAPEEVIIKINCKMFSLFENKTVYGKINLGAYGVLVIKDI